MSISEEEFHQRYRSRRHVPWEGFGDIVRNAHLVCVGSWSNCAALMEFAQVVVEADSSELHHYGGIYEDVEVPFALFRLVQGQLNDNLDEVEKIC